MNMIKKLQDHRSILLGCEAIGWLHMSGKASPDFLEKYGGSLINFQVTDWHHKENIDVDNIFKLITQTPSLSFNQNPIDIRSLFDEYSKNNGEGILGILQASHGIVSGIEKQSFTESSVSYLAQNTAHMWLTSPFGHPMRNLLISNTNIQHQNQYVITLNNIRHLLNEYSKLSINANKTENITEWQSWRDSAIGLNGWLRNSFVNTIAETRIPNNDITLWDQSYIAAALFKAGVAGLILTDGQHESNIKLNMQWRVLTIAIAGEFYEEHAIRIGDWTGAREIIERFFDDVCQYIEVDLAIGSLVYKDDDILAFTFPAIESGCHNE